MRPALAGPSFCAMFPCWRYAPDSACASAHECEFRLPRRSAAPRPEERAVAGTCRRADPHVVLAVRLKHHRRKERQSGKAGHHLADGRFALRDLRYIDLAIEYSHHGVKPPEIVV